MKRCFKEFLCYLILLTLSKQVSKHYWYAIRIIRTFCLFIEKQAEERENNLSEIVISRMPSGELAAIKYNRQRVTRWRSELQRAEFEENEAKTALALKELIEQGVFTPEDGLEKFEVLLSLFFRKMLSQEGV